MAKKKELPVNMKAIFRKDLEDNTILAVLAAGDYTVRPDGMLEAYDMRDGHVPVDINYVRDSTVPATQEESAVLESTLSHIYEGKLSPVRECKDTPEDMKAALLLGVVTQLALEGKSVKFPLKILTIPYEAQELPAGVAQFFGNLRHNGADISQNALYNEVSMITSILELSQEEGITLNGQILTEWKAQATALLSEFGTNYTMAEAVAEALFDVKYMGFIEDHDIPSVLAAESNPSDLEPAGPKIS